MNVIEALRNPLAAPVSAKIAAVLILSLLFWATGVPGLLHHSKAAALYDASDTLSDSDLGVVAGHTFTFSVPSRISTNSAGTATGTIAFTFNANTGQNFAIGTLSAASFSATSSITVVSNCTLGGAGTNKALIATTSTTFTLSLCANNFIATTTTGLSFFIASTSGPITNPNATNSYTISVVTKDLGQAGTKDSVTVDVAILDDVVVTASVDTTFTFTVAGLPPGTSVNGTTTSAGITTTATAIPFGTLAPGVPKVLGQLLNVSTNASNGFTVTVQADQTLTSSNGDTIDVFKDGSGEYIPVAFTAPTATFGTVNTYGHWGITSDDATLGPTQPGGTDAFGTALFAGNFSTSTLPVFYNSGPAFGTAAGVGSTTVAYAAQISNLQEAGDDYTAALTYVATPVF